jgi:hypothetical protein
LRLSRKTAHLVLQWCINSTGSFPALVFEQNNGPIAILFEAEAYLCAAPFFGPVDHLPQHPLAGLKLENLHVEAAVTKAELQHAADLAFPSRVTRPPARKSFDGVNAS